MKTTEKELRVFVISANHVETSGYDIDDWVATQEREGELPEDAKDFINNAEKFGSVYTLSGFQFAFNVVESIGVNDWIFITNKY